MELLSQKTIDESKWGNDVKHLIEELSIYQIELEHQNEELIRSQEDTRIANQKYVGLFENAPISYIIVNNDNKIIEVNETFCRTFYVLKKEIINTPFDRYISPIYQDAFYHFFKLLSKETGKMASIEVKIRGPRSREIYVKIDATSEVDSPHHYRLAITDISLQKKLEMRLRNEAEKLSKSEARFRQIVEQSSNIFFYEDLRTNRIEYISPKITNLLGYEPEEICSMSTEAILALQKPRYRSKYLDMYNLLRDAETREEHYVTREFEIKTKNNEQKWVEGSYSLVFDESGNPTSILGCMQDISERKNFETELVNAKDKAEESDRLKSAFLANMSHEIRTPLNGILGFSGLLKESLEEKNEDTASVEIIEKCGNRLLEVINDILSISKIESHQLEIKKESFDLNALLIDSENIFRLEAAQKGLSISYKKKFEGNDLFIVSDKEKITSVVYNLIKNAIKYTQKGSIEFGLENKPEEIYFYVKDTGIGIVQEKQDMIFNSFSQVTGTGFNEGVGLGLSISKGIIELLGGEINVVSELGKGSTFFFTLPHSRSGSIRPEMQQSIEDGKRAEKKKAYIIVADDDYFSYQLLQKYLVEINAKIDHVSNGNDLMELLEKSVPDLILLDINMPNKNGIQCLREIRKKEINTKIFVQTAYAQDKDEKRYLNIGADAYISKPIVKNELLCKIRNLL